MKKLFPVFTLALIQFLCSCQNQESSEKEMPTVVATTSILGDAVSVLLEGVDSVQTLALMGPGVDPHLYKPSQGDITQLSNANLIVYNGLRLEGKMQGVLEKLKNKPVFAAGKALNEGDLINATEFGGAYDPHIWFDPLLWKQVIKGLSEKLKKQFPQYLAQIEKNEQTYQQKLDILHRNTILLLDNIQEDQRILVTAHDAFKYFGRVYQIQVEGLQGISTTAEYGIKDVGLLADLIAENSIKAIFVESSVPKRSIEAVLNACESRGAQVVLGGELYSDALGGPDSNADTYLKMFQHNVETITTALQ